MPEGYGWRCGIPGVNAEEHSEGHMTFFCPECGKQIDDDGHFCKECGCGASEALNAGPLQSAVVLENRYVIDRLIKSGGMGSVYRAFDQKLETMIALKELLPPSGSQEDHIQAHEWFNREAKLLARLDHPSLPRVFDYFITGDRYYLVMTFIEGEDLEARLKREGRPGLPEDDVIGWACQVLKVLEYLHSHHPPIVYRDIKPSNIMLHRDGRVILVDFGIARSVSPDTDLSGTAVGTDGYAPPEQLRGMAEPRSDLYALGAAMHHLLTGEPPIPFLLKPLKSIDDSFSSHIDHVVSQALKEYPEDRFRSASEMLKALSDYSASVQSSASMHYAAAVPISPKKRFAFSTAGEVLSSPVILRDRLYFGSRDRYIYCLDASYGEVIWKYETKGAVTSSPALMENSLYIGSCDQHLYCLDAVTGELKWKFPARNSVESSPVVYGSRVYAGSSDESLHCIDINSGEQLWEFKTGGSVMASPAVHRGKVYIGSFDQHFHCIDAESGALIWRIDHKYIITSKACISQERLYVTDGGNRINSFSLQDGLLIWRFDTGISWISVWLDSSPVISGGRLYFGSYDRYFYCMDSQNSRIIWKYRTGGKITTSPCIAGPYIFFGSDDRRIYCLHAKDGTKIWDYETLNAVRSSPAVSGGRVYFGSNDNMLYCIDMGKSALTAPSTLTGNCS